METLVDAKTCPSVARCDNTAGQAAAEGSF